MKSEFHFSGSPAPHVLSDITFSDAHTLYSEIWLL